MPRSLRQSAWWVWVLPMAIGADLPLLGLGFFAAHITDNTLFSLCGWLSAILVSSLAIWTASRDISYGYWLGILSGTTGVSFLVFHRLLWDNRKEWYDNLYRIAPGLRQALDLDLLRYAGLFAIAFGVLFLVYDAVAQRKS